MANDPAQIEAAQVFAYTIQPRIHQPIHIKALPNSVCYIAAEGEADIRRSLRVFSGPDGEVRFHVHSSNESEELAKLVVTSTAHGNTVHYQVNLRTSHTPTNEMPLPPAYRSRMMNMGDRRRPALSFEEALRLTPEESVARGYPLRPNPEDAPKAFDSWLRSVSMPMTIIEPHLVTNPNMSHGKAAPAAGLSTSNNWSGFELRRSIVVSGPTFPPHATLTPAYDWVKAVWQVPAVTGQIGLTCYSAFWVGLDGDGTTDLVQAGTEQDGIKIPFPFGIISISTYYVWTEFLPQQGTEQIISNFPVAAGDEILTEVWMGNAGSIPTLAGAFGCFLIMNVTQGTTAQIYTPVGTTRVGGSEAVWIMERPLIPSGFPSLANYGTVYMTEAQARRVNSAAGQGYVSYEGANTKQITMVNGADTLSTASSISPSWMRFDWKSFT